MIPANFPDRSVVVVGLGYVGLTLAVELAAAGFRVHGIDVRADIIGALDKGEPHFWEDGLAERLRYVLASGRFTYSAGLPRECDATVFVITVGTPLDASGRARLDMIENACREIAQLMRSGSLIILRSTVRIGTARKVVMPVLAATGKAFELAVCPERTLEGRALTELHELPQIIGADSSETAHRASQLFGFLTPTTLRVHGLETAEIIKLVDNTYRDVTFAFGNEVARICDAVGVSAHEVISAGKLGYARTNVAMPGPVGGPCLEKDAHILRESCRDYDLELDITSAGRRINERQPLESARFLRGVFPSKLRDGFTIAMLGVAFKGYPATNDTRGTMAVPIIRALRAEFAGARFRAFDPQVSTQESAALLDCPAVDTLEQAFAGADIVCVLNAHVAFRSMPVASLSAAMSEQGVIYDFWNLFSGKIVEFRRGVKYVAVGSHCFANDEWKVS